MNGIYIHIPFCRQACRYCDFCFTVSLRYRDAFVAGLLKEIEEKIPGGKEMKGHTLYLGGGTPSALQPVHIQRILEELTRRVDLKEDAEITIECNPDDLDVRFLRFLKKAGFNRLSIGIQSFREPDLRLMHRSHTAQQAERCVKDAADAGFERISMDLIYGIPGQPEEAWVQNLTKAVSLPIDHLSAYHLSFEPKTVFDHWRKKGRLLPVNESLSIRNYRLLRQYMGEAGLEQYEISNFARDGRYSVHNLMYWSGHTYLGLGPSAHSFDGRKRSWNTPSLKRYLKGMERGSPERTEEELTTVDSYHDHLITSLRTKWGTDLMEVGERFGPDFLAHFRQHAGPFLREGVLVEKEGRIRMDPGQWLITDHILRELFVDEGEREAG